MSTFPTELKNFTPVMDIITEEVGLMSSVIYGLVWRHCHMKDKVCKKSAGNLAEMLKIDEKTVRRHLQRLCDGGYIKDLTPDLQGAPHIYVLTDKIEITGQIEARLTTSDFKSEVVKNRSGTSDLKSDPPRTLSPNFHKTSDFKSDLPRTLSPISKTLHEETFKETGGDSESPPTSFSMSVEELSRNASKTYTEIEGLKLDKIHRQAIAEFIKSTPGFDPDLWHKSCKSCHLSNVNAGNVQCRIDVYRNGGDYQAMLDRRRNGQPERVKATPAAQVLADDVKRAAYEALQAESAAAETLRQQIDVGSIKAAGIDVQKKLAEVAKARRSRPANPAPSGVAQ